MSGANDAEDHAFWKLKVRKAVIALGTVEQKWQEGFTVGRRALAAVVRQTAQTPAILKSLLYRGALRGRTLCSGIGAVEEATQQLAAACHRLGPRPSMMLHPAFDVVTPRNGATTA